MDDLDLPARIGGRYRPIREIGRGGMGIVYEVEHQHTGERLALKLLVSQSNASGDTVDRFKREARASAQIKSEHVVRVTDADVASEAHGAPFIVMELLQGTDLDKATRTEAQPPSSVVEWLRQVARALDKAHGLGIVHRDLKPENLFLSQRDDGTPLVKILDFGIVKMVTEDNGTTQEGQVLGTPMYMAPEQINREGARISPATDRYALGLIAHKLLTGRHYRDGETLVQVVADVMRGRVVPPSERGSTCGAAFDGWFERACHPDPSSRYPSAGEQIEDLARTFGLPVKPIESSSNRAATGDPVVGTSTLESAPTLEVETLPRTTGSFPYRRAWLYLLVVGVVAGFSVAVFMARRQPAPEPAGIIETAAPGGASLSTPEQPLVPPLLSSPAASSISAPSPSASGSIMPPRPPVGAIAPATTKPRPGPSSTGAAASAESPDPLADQK